MIEFPFPKIIISKCLGFFPCRWNGIMISSPIIDSLKPFVEFHPVCPELEIGLGVPRHPIRIIEKKGNHFLIQPATGKDLTEIMTRFSHKYLNSIDEVDGWILKSRSPSCGIKNVKIFTDLENNKPKGRGRGFFGREVLNFYPLSAVEDEGRLKNFRIREHFFTKIFTKARFRKINKSMPALIKFHSNHKLLLMSYNQETLRRMGKITANTEKKVFNEVISTYGNLLEQTLALPPRSTSNINVLMHALGFFSKKLSSREKAYFLDVINQYKLGKIPLSVPVTLLKSWIIRFNEPYLKNQTFFQPFPDELNSLSDLGKKETQNKGGPK